MAMVKIAEEIKKRNLKSKLILQVHDELVFDALDSEKDEITEIMHEIMEHNYELNVPLNVDIEYGDNWYQLK